MGEFVTLFRSFEGDKWQISDSAGGSRWGMQRPAFPWQYPRHPPTPNLPEIRNRQLPMQVTIWNDDSADFCEFPPTRVEAWPVNFDNVNRDTSPGDTA